MEAELNTQGRLMCQEMKGTIMMKISLMCHIKEEGGFPHLKHHGRTQSPGSIITFMVIVLNVMHMVIK